MSSTTEKKLILKSSDGQEFEVEEKVAVLSLTIKNMVDDDCSSGVIPLPNVDSKTLSKVIEYCKRHAAEEDKEDTKDEAALKTFDRELVDEKDQKLLFDVILAANYLNIKGLLDLLCQKVADMMKGKTPEAIRELFHIKNDYTPEEEEEVRRENAWAFE